MALLKRRPRGSRPIVAADFSREMLRRGAESSASRRWAAANRASRIAEPLEADALHLPLRPESLDLIVTAFGFRNLANYEAGLQGVSSRAEAGRAVGHSGVQRARASCLARPMRSTSIACCRSSGGWSAASYGPYNYLPASVGSFLRPVEMLELMRAAGFEQCAWQPYTFGIAGLYTAVRCMSGDHSIS